MSDAISVLIVDDHPLLREGVTAVLEAEPDIRVVGEAADGLDAIAQFKNLRPDLVLMDLQMPGVDGVEAISAIRAIAPDARIIVLTTYAGDVRALSALRAGASGSPLPAT